MTDIEKELGEWRHFHFDGRRDGEHKGNRNSISITKKLI